MTQKPQHGFVKTENAVLLMVIGIAAGFVAGIIFSAYRSTGSLPSFSVTTDSKPAPINELQSETLAELIEQSNIDPGNFDTWAQLGHLYFDTGQPDKAIKAYKAALDIDDQRPDIWTDLGVMYRRIKNPKKSVECFDHALAINPNHEVALFNKGIVLMHDLQNAEGALEQWQKLVSVNPEAHTPSGLMVKEMIEEIKKTK